MKLNNLRILRRPVIERQEGEFMISALHLFWIVPVSGGIGVFMMALFAGSREWNN